MIRPLVCAAAAFVTTGVVWPVRAMQQDSSDARVVIIVDSLDRAAFANVAELLQARVPGLHIARTGDGGLRWYMRGPASALESTPLVLVDDVRFNVAGSGLREIGTRPPLLDEIDIEDVERVEIWSGAATAAEHGSGAANGLIRIGTFVPRAQNALFRIATQGGLLEDQVTYPANFARPGVDTAGRFVSRCTLRSEANGFCTPTGPPTSINPLETESPFETAIATRVRAALASGGEVLAWRGGLTFDHQGSTARTLANQRFHVRGAGTLRASSNARVTMRAHWTRGDADLPARQGMSFLHQGLFARADTAWRGFVEPPLSRYHATRYGVNASGEWQPREWLDARVTIGVDQMSDADDAAFILPGPQGFEPFHIMSRGERRRREVNVRLDARATYDAAALRYTTAAVIERAEWRQEEEFMEIGRSGDLDFGRSFWFNRPTDITGIGVTQEVRFRQRAALRGGLRLDRVKSSNTRWDLPLFPYISARWDARPSSAGTFGAIRVRAALGDVANVPQTSPPVLGFVPVSPNEDPPKAEVTRERELGVDMTALQERLALSVAGYVKRTSSVGSVHPHPFLGNAFALTHIEVRNRGIEASLGARILQTNRSSWDARVRYAYNHNEVTRNPMRHPVPFGELPLGSRQVVWPEEPLAGYLAVNIVSIQDLDGDGVADSFCFEGNCEVRIRWTDGLRPAFPPTSASVETSLRFGGLRLTALLDHRSGHAIQNATFARRCFIVCQALYDPASSLDEQAEALLGAEGAIEDATYTKLREVSLRFSAPIRWASAFGASELHLSVAGRNLMTWTDYSGLDPESTSLPWVPLAQVDDAAVPLPRRLVVRIDLLGR